MHFGFCFLTGHLCFPTEDQKSPNKEAVNEKPHLEAAHCGCNRGYPLAHSEIDDGTG